MNSDQIQAERDEYYSALPLPEERLMATPISPNNPPWTSPVAFGVWLLSVALIVFIPMLFLLPYVFSVSGPNVDQQTIAQIATSDPTSVLIQVAAILPVHLITLAVAWFVVTRIRTFRFTETLGWRSGGMRWWHHLAVLAAFVALMLVVGSYFPEQENDLLRILKSSKLALYTVAFLAVFTAPLVEEVIYRGVLFSAFQRSLGQVGAVALVTFLFALVHVPQYYPSYSTIFLLTILSLILTLVRLRTGNLLPCIILHTLFNGLQSLGLILEPYLPSPNSTAEQAAALIRLM